LDTNPERGTITRGVLFRVELPLIRPMAEPLRGNPIRTGVRGDVATPIRSSATEEVLYQSPIGDAKP
jgi:hypothetical protein